MAASPSRRTSGRPQTSPHYDPSTSGTWDGQLPHPDVAGQLSPAGLLEKPPRDWPSIIERDGFADLATVTFNLTGPESAVLRRILFRAGSASQGCWESLPNMGRYLGFNERTVRRALARLLGLGLIHKVKAYHGDGKSNCYVPVLRIAHSGLSVQNDADEGSIPDSASLHSGLSVQNDADEGLAPGFVDSHSGLSVQNGENETSILDFVSLHSGLSVHQTEGTEIVIHSESKDSEFQRSYDTGDSKMASTSVHSGQRVQNGASPAPIPDTESEMSSSPSATSITECHVCGLPWTTDAGRHLTAIRRGLREFICDECRESQISQSGGIDRLVIS